MPILTSRRYFDIGMKGFMLYIETWMVYSQKENETKTIYKILSSPASISGKI